MAISIGRLSGGNTPADGSDPRTFPAIWNATADTLEGLSNTVDGLEVGDLADATVTSPSFGQPLTYDPVSEQWVNDSGNYPVMVFADSTARSSAIPSPSEGMVTYVEDANRVEVFDGSTFGPIGGILQVVSTTKIDTFSASVAGGAFVSVTGLSASITPSSLSSKVLVLADVNGTRDGIGAISMRLMRDSTPISVATGAGSRVPATSAAYADAADNFSLQFVNGIFLDAPSTASSISYSVEVGTISSATQTVLINRMGTDSDNDGFVRTVSSITLMEVAV